MTEPYEAASSFLEGTETVTLRYGASLASSRSVSCAIRGALRRSELAILEAGGFAGSSASWELDEEWLGGVVPARGDRIESTANGDWIILSTEYDHVIGVYRCTCGKVVE